MNTIKKNLFLYLSFIFLSYSFYNIIFYPVYNTDGGMIVLLWPLFILALVWIIFSSYSFFSDSSKFCGNLWPLFAN